MNKDFYVYFYVAEIGPKMDPLSGARNHMGGPKDHEYISGVKLNFLMRWWYQMTFGSFTPWENDPI